MRIFVAGANGVLGRALVPALVLAGHDVVGTTRSAARTGDIQGSGATPIVCDALDPDAVRQAVALAEPEVVIHQLSALPARFGALRQGTAATDRLRREGTRNLLDAARAVGVRRIIAESVAFLYRPGDGLASEDAPIWTGAPGTYAETVAALVDLETAVTSATGIEGVVLRYGTVYGPGTWFAADGDLITQVRRRRMPVMGAGDGVMSFVHVQDAAAATVAAVRSDTAPGIYNITDDDPVRFAELLPAMAEMVGAPSPLRLPTWLARPLAGSVGVAVLTEQRGASNSKAAAELGWHPERPSWRQGLAAEVDGAQPA